MIQSVGGNCDKRRLVCTVATIKSSSSIFHWPEESSTSSALNVVTSFLGLILALANSVLNGLYGKLAIIRSF